MEDDVYGGSILLPPMKVCPFCRSAKLKVQTVWNEYRYVCCRNCRAAGPAAKIEKHNVGKADERAVERWNHSDYRQLDATQMRDTSYEISPDLDEIEMFLDEALGDLNDIQNNEYSSWPQLDAEEIRYVFGLVDKAQGAACECGRVVKEMRGRELRGSNDEQ